MQATDRLGMIQSIGRLIQQVITAASLSVSILLFSPWLLLLLIAGILPAFLGESHFAFLGYAKNFRQTPIRRELDYLRVLGGSREAAKELKLFGLKDFLIGRFTRLSDQIYVENVDLARRRLIAGSLLIDNRHRRLLLSLCVRDLADRGRGAEHWHAHISDGRHRAGQQQHPADFLHAFQHRRPGFVPYGLAGIFCDEADHSLEAKCVACAPADHARIRVSQCLASVIPEIRGWCWMI